MLASPAQHDQKVLQFSSSAKMPYWRGQLGEAIAGSEGREVSGEQCGNDIYAEVIYRAVAKPFAKISNRVRW